VTGCVADRDWDVCIVVLAGSTLACRFFSGLLDGGMSDGEGDSRESWLSDDLREARRSEADLEGPR
jgi:hypothetical protein